MERQRSRRRRRRRGASRKTKVELQLVRGEERKRERERERESMSEKWADKRVMWSCAWWQWEAEERRRKEKKEEEWRGGERGQMWDGKNPRDLKVEKQMKRICSWISEETVDCICSSLRIKLMQTHKGEWRRCVTLTRERWHLLTAARETCLHGPLIKSRIYCSIVKVHFTCYCHHLANTQGQV